MDIQHGSGLSPFGPRRHPDDARTDDRGASRRERRKRWLLIAMRYGVPLVVFVAGLVILLADADRDTALEASFTFFGAAIAILLLNVFFRIGMRGDNERDREEDARRYFDEHGHWPDEARPSG